MKDQTKSKYGEQARLSDDIYKHNMHDRHKHLVNFRELDDYKVAEGDPDVRGWKVFTADNMEVGKVEDMVVDTNAMKVRYLVVDLYDDYAADTLDHYLLLPVGAARLNESDNQISVSGIKTTTVLNYPIYRRDGISREYEYSIRNFFERGGVPATGSTDRGPVHRSSVSGTHNPEVHGARTRYDIETSHMEDTTRSDSDTISGSTHTTSSNRDVAGAKTFGESNLTTGADTNQRVRHSGLSPRTSNLENKEIPQGPSEPGMHTSGTDDERSTVIPPRQNVAADSELRRADHTEGQWHDTSNLNSSNSLSNEPKRGSTLGNEDLQPTYGEGREMPNRRDIPTDDQFYKHDHFDEEVFYARRRRRNDDD